MKPSRQRTTRRRTLAAAACALLTAALAGPALAASQAPRLNFADRVNPVPRPYSNRLDVTTATSIYFEILVPDSNGSAGRVDTNSITARLIPDGEAEIPMLRRNQQFQPGFTGRIFPGIDSGSSNGDAVYIVPDNPLQFDKRYTVVVDAKTLDGVPISQFFKSWSFTTRPAFPGTAVSWSVDLTGPTIRWEGWFFTGIVKPDFDTSRMFDQLDSYDLMDTVTAINPDAWSLQRDWPLTSDYWHNGVFDGNPNLVRERETRRIAAIATVGGETHLTVEDLEEGPLYGIPPNRPLGGDYLPGDQVTVTDRTKHEVATVLGVDEAARVVRISLLATPPSQWVLDYPGSHPADNPDTPDNFTLPLCYLRKLDPVGTPVYYWTRLDDEWDIVHGQHGRRVQVNFSYTPLDLSRVPVPAHPGGHGSISPPKNWPQWHDFVREVVFHLIDRYGPATQDFQYTFGNENNFSIFWGGTKDEFYETYDYTINAVLTAFEDRGLDAGRVVVGGIEAASLGGLPWTKDALYHCSGAADKPGGGIAEQNFVCANPAFDGKRAARVSDLCAAHGGKGSPLDIVSIHEYEHASRAAADITQIRDDALAMDPVFYDRLIVGAFEATPDWIPRPDPASEYMYEGNGYFPTWCADWMHRLVARAGTDARYARHEALLTVWPFDYNGDGIASVTGLIRVDDDADGTEDRIATIRKGVFNYIELLAGMNRDLAALPERDLEGVRFGGVRSPAPDAHRILLHTHDKYDTESREPAAFTANLSLTGVPWPKVTVRRWRVDRDHSSPYHAYQDLPDRGGSGLYSPAEIAPLEAADDLVEDGPPRHLDATGGALSLAEPLRVNGVTFLEIREQDFDGDGAALSGDCDDADPSVWAVPGEARDLRLSHDGPGGVTTLSWAPPAETGGAAGSTLYDTIRSSEPADFATGAVCVESDDGADTEATDAATPPPGGLFGYLVRAENACPAGQGPLGNRSDGSPRSARNCP